MRRISLVASLTVLLVAVYPSATAAQGLLDPRRDAKSMIDASLGYVLITGQVGDSLKGGPGIEASFQYQLENVPLRLGGGVGYSRHGVEEPVEASSISGSSNKWSAFALGTLLLFSDDTDMIPYVQARLGYTSFATSADGVDSSLGGIELGALVGVDLPVSERISIDVSGLFAWINTGNASVDGVSIPDSSRSGSVFSIRAGAFFFL